MPVFHGRGFLLFNILVCVVTEGIASVPGICVFVEVVNVLATVCFFYLSRAYLLSRSVQSVCDSYIYVTKDMFVSTGFNEQATFRCCLSN